MVDEDGEDGDGVEHEHPELEQLPGILEFRICTKPVRSNNLSEPTLSHSAISGRPNHFLFLAMVMSKCLAMLALWMKRKSWVRMKTPSLDTQATMTRAAVGPSL